MSFIWLFSFLSPITPLERAKELKPLVRAIRAAAEASDIKKRFKWLIDDHEAARREGVDVNSLHLGVKISKQFVVEEVT